jgi:hypothetical protein
MPEMRVLAGSVRLPEAAVPFGVADSTDSAIVVTLPCGSYTAQVSGDGNSAGTALA